MGKRNILKRIFNRENRSIENKTVYINFGSSSTDVSKAMEDDATVFACVNLIANAISNIPNNLMVYKKDGQAVKAGFHPLYNVAKYEPNPDETPTLFYYTLVLHYLRGNVYIYKAIRAGNIEALYLLNPANMTVSRNQKGEKEFKYISDGQTIIYTSKEILHIPSKYGYDGLTGKSIFSFGQKSIKLAMELNDFSINSFKNGLGKRLAIKMPNLKGTPEEKEIIENKLIQKYGGKDNSGIPLIYNEAFDFKYLDGSDTPEAAQLIQQREFQQNEIAKLFLVPLVLLGVGQNKYNTMEQLYRIFIDFTLAPITAEIEQSFLKMIPINERKNFAFKFDFNSLQRYDLETRIDAYAKQTCNVGWLTPNEVRAMENRPLSDDPSADYIYIPQNVMPLKAETVDSILAGAKTKMKDLNNDAPAIGDDKK